jgi:hypothetical protein
MRNISEKVEKIKKRFLYSVSFPPPPEIRAVYEIMWRNIVQTDRQASDDNVIRRTRLACWVTKAIETHTQTQTHTQT